MRHLFGTWSTVFPTKVLRKIEVELQFSPASNQQSTSLTAPRSSEESPPPRPSHGIHVNPKYLERRQIEHSSFANDIQQGRGSSSSLQIYGRKPASGYVEFDLDHDEGISPHFGVQGLDSQGAAIRASSVGAAERLLPTKARLARSSSPARIGARSLPPTNDGFAINNSPRRVVEGASPSHSGSEYGPGKATDGDGEKSEWWFKCQQMETSGTYNPSNGCDQQRPRALIDAYGNYRGKNTLNGKPLKVERLDINGINSKEVSKRWQNTEEEEYVWEDMSPTLTDRSRGNDLMPFNPPLGSLSRRTGLERPSTAILESDFRRGNWPNQVQLSTMDDAAFISGDGVSILGSGHVTMGNNSLRCPQTQNESSHVQSSHHSQEPQNFPHQFPQSSQEHLDLKARGRAVQMSFPAAGVVPSAIKKMPSQVDNFLDTDAQFQRFSGVVSRMGSSNRDTMNVEALSTMMPPASALQKHRGQRPSLAPLVWPPVNVPKSHPPPPLSVLPQQNQIKSQSNIMDISRIPNKSLTLPGQHLGVIERNTLTPTKLLQFPNQQAGLISLNQRSQGQASHLPAQPLMSQNAQENFVPSAVAQMSTHKMEQPLNHGHIPQGHLSVTSSILPNPIPGLASSSVTIHGLSNTPFHLPGRALPPLPPGPPPVSSQIEPISQNVGPIATHASSGSAFSGLISSLMAQGLISLTTPASVQDSIGVEFNLDLLKVRHESAIKALYADLPRQCTTCGLRFKCQEEHSSHMDWHVTKNRISKSRKQKPSRKWFVSTNVWLSGAEALGVDAVPGFLPTEAVAEKDDQEMAVPADENQNVCALCGEPFDDFYSDETEEWMYKGAVYLNAPDGPPADMDRSQLGPIVHAKCRSESTVVPPEDFQLDEGGTTEEGNQRKRMRS
ncbi:PREDICTED: polyadenylation and cleavage factor homolog 4 isoform X2 [Nelumbo nucifera]|nr:PREDICTED: polyadenylation and cleavage factor homolog 4 isoform X2 [Nelumbo nucifera]